MSANCPPPSLNPSPPFSLRSARTHQLTDSQQPLNIMQSVSRLNKLPTQHFHITVLAFYCNDSHELLSITKKKYFSPKSGHYTYIGPKMGHAKFSWPSSIAARASSPTNVQFIMHQTSNHTTQDTVDLPTASFIEQTINVPVVLPAVYEPLTLITTSRPDPRLNQMTQPKSRISFTWDSF